MSNPFNERDNLPDAFDDWLKARPVHPSSDFLAHLRKRLQSAEDPAEEILNEVFRMDHSLRNPHMVQLVRSRIRMEPVEVSGRHISWFSWMAPLAAAATLTLAFISFQKSAPRSDSLAMEPASYPMETIDNDAEVTRIFALAANLHSSADVAQLQSVEDLALLFD